MCFCTLTGRLELQNVVSSHTDITSQLECFGRCTRNGRERRRSSCYDIGMDWNKLCFSLRGLLDGLDVFGVPCRWRTILVGLHIGSKEHTQTILVLDRLVHDHW